MLLRRVKIVFILCGLIQFFHIPAKCQEILREMEIIIVPGSFDPGTQQPIVIGNKAVININSNIPLTKKCFQAQLFEILKYDSISPGNWQLHVPPGQLVMNFCPDGFKPILDKILTLQKGEILNLKINALTTQSILHIKSKPDKADLYINDRHVGQTPYTFIGAEETVNIRLVKEDYQDYQTQEKLTAGKEIEIVIPLISRKESQVVNHKKASRWITWGIPVLSVSFSTVLYYVLNKKQDSTTINNGKKLKDPPQPPNDN